MLLKNVFSTFSFCEKYSASSFYKFTILILLSTSSSLVSAQLKYYDKYIYIRPLPMSPILPKTPSDCHKYESSLDKFIAEVNSAHDQCLQLEKEKVKGGVDVNIDVAERCSNSSCQELHTARTKISAEAAKKKVACQTDLANNPAWQRELKRLNSYDKPIQPDPMGDAVLSAGTSIIRKGALAGAQTMAKKTLEETAKYQLGLKEQKNKESSNIGRTSESNKKNKYALERESVEACRKAGGRPFPHTENGCRYVSCSFKDASMNYANMIDRPAGINCSPGYVK